MSALINCLQEDWTDASNKDLKVLNTETIQIFPLNKQKDHNLRNPEMYKVNFTRT